MRRRERAAAEAEAATPWEYWEYKDDGDDQKRQDLVTRAEEIDDIKERSDYVRKEIARWAKEKQDRQDSQSSNWQPAAGGATHSAPPANQSKSTRESSRPDIDQEEAGEAPEAEDKAKINLNIASIWQIKSCPKIGNVLANRIVESRKTEKFTTWAEVRRLSQIGKAITNSLQQKFYLPEDEIEEPARLHLQVMVKDAKAEEEMQHREDEISPPPGDWNSPTEDQEDAPKWKFKRSRRAGQNKRDQRAKENAERSRVRAEQQAARGRDRSPGYNHQPYSEVVKRTGKSIRENSHLVSKGYAQSCSAKAPAPASLASSLEPRLRSRAAAAKASTDHQSVRENSRDATASSHPLG